MKKFLTVLALTAAIAAPAAIASTYKIDATNQGVYFQIDGHTYYSWNMSGLSLNVNDTTKNATLSGIMTRNGSNTLYSLSMAFTNPYTSGANQFWATTLGTLRNNSTGATLQIRDMDTGRDNMDSVMGINAAPYNANTNKLEFGFWAFNAGAHPADLNVTVTCTSGTGANGPANANGTCTTGGGNGVPLPGTLALLGMAALGLGARRIKLS
jgi:hypothetical protein